MKCPHCTVSIHASFERAEITRNCIEGWWAYSFMICPDCHRAIIQLNLRKNTYNKDGVLVELSPADTIRVVQPRVSGRPPCPPEVPVDFAEDYREACLVIGDSAKASAALGRRCLQSLPREREQVGPGDLAAEIQAVLDKKALPSHLAEAIDGIRNVGNFAAHPNKSQSTGEVLPVEPGEAEWNLNTLEGLFDFYFVQPAVLEAKRDALNKKLADAGKPPLKG